MLISQNGSVGGSYSNVGINSSGTDTNSKSRILSAPFQPSSDRIVDTDSSIAPQISRDIEVSYHNFRFQPLEKVSQLKFDKYVGPTPESNWVIPGRLLVGAYPASEDDDETFDLIVAILRQGVSKFVCLQSEYLAGVSRQLWKSGGALRPYFEDVVGIVKNAASLVPGLNIVKLEDLTFEHCPIIDCGVTDDSKVLSLAYKLVRALSEDTRVYLHCWGGHGRTGTVVCIMLHIMYGMSYQEAFQYCQAVHDLRQCPVVVGSPQTQQQRNQVIRVIGQLSLQMKPHSLQENEEVNKNKPANSGTLPSISSNHQSTTLSVGHNNLYSTTNHSHINHATTSSISSSSVSGVVSLVPLESNHSKAAPVRGGPLSQSMDTHNYSHIKHGIEQDPLLESLSLPRHTATDTMVLPQIMLMSNHNTPTFLFNAHIHHSTNISSNHSGSGSVSSNHSGSGSVSSHPTNIVGNSQGAIKQASAIEAVERHQTAYVHSDSDTRDHDISNVTASGNHNTTNSNIIHHPSSIKPLSPMKPSHINSGNNTPRKLMITSAMTQKMNDQDDSSGGGLHGETISNSSPSSSAMTSTQPSSSMPTHTIGSIRHTSAVDEQSSMSGFELSFDDYSHQIPHIEMLLHSNENSLVKYEEYFNKQGSGGSGGCISNSSSGSAKEDQIMPAATTTTTTTINIRGSGMATIHEMDLNTTTSADSFTFLSINNINNNNNDLSPPVSSSLSPPSSTSTTVATNATTTTTNTSSATTTMSSSSTSVVQKALQFASKIFSSTRRQHDVDSDNNNDPTKALQLMVEAPTQDQPLIIQETTISSTENQKILHQQHQQQHHHQQHHHVNDYHELDDDHVNHHHHHEHDYNDDKPWEMDQDHRTNCISTETIETVLSASSINDVVQAAVAVITSKSPSSPSLRGSFGISGGNSGGATMAPMPPKNGASSQRTAAPRSHSGRIIVQSSK